MEYQYTINQIASRCKVSITSINNLKKKNQDFINKNSMRKQHKIYYNQSVMDFFISYYQPEQDAERMENPPIKVELAEGVSPEGEKPLVKPSSTEEQKESLIDGLKAKIDALKAEIDTLRKQLDAKEEERKELLRQNGALLLMLQQEKQEKMLLLPAPKKSFLEKIKSVLKNQNHPD